MKWYTVKEAAERLKVGEGTILLRIKDGRFPHAKKNGKWRIPECCLEGHKEASAEEIKAAEEAKAAEGAKTELSETQARLTERRDELKLEKEVKVLEAEVAGIWNPTAQDRIAEERKELDVEKANLAERERGLAEREDEREAKLVEREEELLEDRKKLEDEQEGWRNTLAGVNADLQTIFDYYKAVCKEWNVKEKVLLSGLKLKDFWGQSGVAAPEEAAPENGGDEGLEEGIEFQL